MVTPKNLEDVFRKYGFRITRETLYEIFAEFDKQEKGGLSFDDLVHIVIAKPSVREMKTEVEKVFKKIARGK